VKIAEDVRRRVIEVDRRYRSSWDVRAVAYVVGIGHQSVAQILREARGPRPKPAKQSHDRRTRFLFRDVMWSSDVVKVFGRFLIKTLDETSRFRVGWELVEAETARAAVAHGEDIIRRMGRAPLVWKYDHGSLFTSRLFQDFLARHQILPYPIPPRSPWVNGRLERDHQEIRNWLIPWEGKEVPTEELDRDIDEGMLMLNHVKPRAVLGYRTSADVYFHTEGIEEMDRDFFRQNLDDIKCDLGCLDVEEPEQMKSKGGERIHRKAVRRLLQNWGLYEEWKEMPKGAKFVNRSGPSDVAF
jgi:transposase InsO family protein